MSINKSAVKRRITATATANPDTEIALNLRHAAEAEQIETLCLRIATSREGVGRLCKQLGLTPSRVWRLLAESEQYQQRYTHARAVQMEILSDEMMEVANSATAENVQAVRLQIDTMKWLMSKLLPKKYGDLPATQVNIGTSGQTLVITPELAARIQEQRKQALARIEAPEQQAAERN